MCIIAYLTLNKQTYLAKNRDRYYITPIKIVRERINGVEILYLIDLKTGWIEGINEFGIAIVNSVLPTEAEETFTRYVGKNSMVSQVRSVKKKHGGSQLQRLHDKLEINTGGTSNRKKGNNDGKIILQALSQSRIEDALSILVSCNCYTNYGIMSKLTTGLNGHTIISNGRYTFSVENPSKTRPVVREISKRCVRTNTPVYISTKKGGYNPVTNKLGYISSRKRYQQAKGFVKGITKPDQILPKLATINYEDPCNSPYRIGHRCDNNYLYGFATTSQILFEINNKQMVLHTDQYNTDYLGFVDRIGNDAKTKLMVQEFIRPEYKPTTLQSRRPDHKLINV